MCSRSARASKLNMRPHVGHILSFLGVFVCVRATVIMGWIPSCCRYVQHAIGPAANSSLISCHHRPMCPCPTILRHMRALSVLAMKASGETNSEHSKPQQPELPPLCTAKRASRSAFVL
ncbi:hypothetical protein BDU57DRAFT_523083 [Ampelomyces quisqualis]|uniref:Uncharacterized protein n=1 Tax=Ampelomyces quisqualis TaxID=50730 RepID=A0A6A5QCT7_AMPQU|nr:hypothetical protein BDU57DRAFT_523083 [Ampelomyces quisqualis]